MRRKKLLLAMLACCMAATTANAQKYLGGDISMLPAYEAKSANYKDKDGKKISDVLLFLKEQGCNAMRVRLFVDPNREGIVHDAVGAIQDLPYVKDLGKRIKDAGMAFMLDFHYSDTWTDPGKHSTPASWTATTANELAETLYNYTYNSLVELKNAGAEPDFIQVGNEITYGQLWPTGHIWPAGGGQDGGSWDNFYLYVKKGTEACRSACPNAKVVIHVEMSGQGKNVKPFLQNFLTYNPDFDIIGLSYYPYHHGNLTNLNNLLTNLETTYPNKKIQLVEAGYPNAWYPSDASFDYTSVYPATEEGQRKFTADLITKLNAHENVNGLYWWYPEALGNYVDAKNWYNMNLWNNSNYRALKALYELKNFVNDPAGIEQIANTHHLSPNTSYYDLQGRKVAQPKQGLYITHGKKFVVK